MRRGWLADHALPLAAVFLCMAVRAAYAQGCTAIDQYQTLTGGLCQRDLLSSGEYTCGVDMAKDGGMQGYCDFTCGLNLYDETVG